MDNLTHSLVGLFLSRAGVNRWSPRATAIVVLAANLPDVDVVSAMGGAPGYLHWHRAWTHSLLAMPLEALVAVALVRVAGTGAGAPGARPGPAAPAEPRDRAAPA